MTTYIDHRPEWLQAPEAAQPRKTETVKEYNLAQAIDWRYDENLKLKKSHLIDALRNPVAYVLLGWHCDDGAWDCSISQLALMLAVHEVEPKEYRGYAISAGNGEWNVERSGNWVGGCETLDGARDFIDLIATNRADEEPREDHEGRFYPQSPSAKWDHVSWQD